MAIENFSVSYSYDLIGVTLFLTTQASAGNLGLCLMFSRMVLLKSHHLHSSAQHALSEISTLKVITETSLPHWQIKTFVRERYKMHSET